MPDWRNAERATAAWMSEQLGERVVTGSGSADGGIDVAGRAFVGQVKYWRSKVGRPEVQNIYGIAQARGVVAAGFSSGGYTRQAMRWADTAGVALFSFTMTDGTYRAVCLNGAARDLLRSGLGPEERQEARQRREDFAAMMAKRLGASDDVAATVAKLEVNRDNARGVFRALRRLRKR